MEKIQIITIFLINLKNVEILYRRKYKLIKSYFGQVLTDASFAGIKEKSEQCPAIFDFFFVPDMKTSIHNIEVILDKEDMFMF